ncbi:hypothetical protein RR21198_4003 [Rhodococcus rhodochrous ATCC 21198]|uniref:hypothetical protein n=1 Tax=Rhodococcus aetherivorans TaxID=191292 RepID=UPI0003E27265|nr:hypothetical protein [Rhodococcus aetherivorans]ETT25263.1 hypothetical protein RR21198_4003 [Rhodococcus rhodochrous ATCC 21198]NGP28464.1 hypothetical protein [Rhodococcus aetherivorans]
MALGLNIVAKRKVSLKGFADGWDDCYLIVRSLSEKERKQWSEEAQARQTDDARQNDQLAEELTKKMALDVIVGGVVITTDEDGSQRAVEVTTADVPGVVEALEFYWRNEAVSVATGADRLKAMI